MERDYWRLLKILREAADVICAKGYSEPAFDAILDFLEEEPELKLRREKMGGMTITMNKPDSPGFVFIPVVIQGA